MCNTSNKISHFYKHRVSLRFKICHSTCWPTSSHTLKIHSSSTSRTQVTPLSSPKLDSMPSKDLFQLAHRIIIIATALAAPYHWLKTKISYMVESQNSKQKKMGKIIVVMASSAFHKITCWITGRRKRCKNIKLLAAMIILPGRIDSPNKISAEMPRTKLGSWIHCQNNDDRPAIKNDISMHCNSLKGLVSSKPNLRIRGMFLPL